VSGANIESDLTVHWRLLQPRDEGLQFSACLYAMLAPNKKRIVYIGKAWRATVAERLRCRTKGGLWMHLDDCRISKCFVLLGELILPQGRRLSGALLSDVESLLIMGEQPTGNVQSMNSRIDRPGLCVACAGRWPGKAKHYFDGDVNTYKRKYGRMPVQFINC
jgi:hypothetical protein